MNSIRTAWGLAGLGAVASLLAAAPSLAADGRPVPGHEGFGSHLEKASIRGLQGSIERDWRPDGLTVTMRFPLRSLAS